MAPSSHPQAQFVPISPDLDLHTLVENTVNFDYVTRLSTEKLKEHSIQSFEALVLQVVIQNGKPLVIEDWGGSLPPWLYSPAWIQDNLGSKRESIHLPLCRQTSNLETQPSKFATSPMRSTSP